MRTITIQPGQPGEGMEYNVNKPLPYPWHIDAGTGDVLGQDFWQGDPLALVGFQSDADVQRVDLHVDAFAADPETAVGMYPVFCREDGGFYNVTVPVTRVSVIES